MLTVLANWPMQSDEAELVQATWPAGIEVIYASRHDAAALEYLAERLDVIVGRVPLEVLRRALRLRYVQVLGHGIDRINQGEIGTLMRERGIPIARANPAAIAISEFVLMALIALNRRVIQAHEALAHRGDWSPALVAGRFQGAMGGELYGSTLCIAGLGSIGQAITQRAMAFGMRVGALTRRPEHYDACALGLDFLGPLTAPEPFLARSRHLVIALPLTDDTRTFLGPQQFAAMPEGSFLVNIGRAAMVDQAAMHGALASGRLAGAAVDVWPDEINRSYPSPLPIHHFNVIMTPHSAAITRETRIRSIVAAGENLRRVMLGQDLLNAAGVDA